MEHLDQWRVIQLIRQSIRMQVKETQEIHGSEKLYFTAVAGLTYWFTDQDEFISFEIYNRSCSFALIIDSAICQFTNLVFQTFINSLIH